MPNRILKESICTNDQIDRLSPFEEVFFYRLIVNVDDFGRADGRASVLRARLFPLREDISAEVVVKTLDKLVETGLVARYSVDGRDYIFLPGWNRNQKVRSKREKCPPPPGWQQPVQDAQQVAADAQQVVADAQQVVSDCARNPIQSESEAESEAESEPESGSKDSKKEKEEIYNNSWRYSPRARAATANILCEQFRRERLPCAEIRDLFPVVERGLSFGIEPEEIARFARILPAHAFAARYMSMGVGSS